MTSGRQANTFAPPAGSAETGLPAITRLMALAALTAEERCLLDVAVANAWTVPARRPLPIGDGNGRLLLLSGWAIRPRIYADGRRQIIHVRLPGDLVEASTLAADRRDTAEVALTDVVVAKAPEPMGRDCGLSRAYHASRDCDREILFRQIGRLGRLDARERILDWLTEVGERLALAGLVDRRSFDLPVTQELIADTLGLTSVHVNRMLQRLRRDGTLDLQHGRVIMSDRR